MQQGAWEWTRGQGQGNKAEQIDLSGPTLCQQRPCVTKSMQSLWIGVSKLAVHLVLQLLNGMLERCVAEADQLAAQPDQETINHARQPGQPQEHIQDTHGPAASL